MLRRLLCAVLGHALRRHSWAESPAGWRCVALCSRCGRPVPTGDTFRGAA
jgi:hypothetical protein